MGLWLVGPRPVLSKGGHFQQPRPERHLHVRVPALSMTRPRSLRGALLTNSFVTLFLPLQSSKNITRYFNAQSEIYRSFLSSRPKARHLRRSQSRYIAAPRD